MLAKWRCASLAAKRRFQTCLAFLVDQTKLCEASKDRTTLADSQCSLLFHCYWTRVLENRTHPRAIFMIRHPSYPSVWAYVMHVTLDPRLPLFSRVHWKDRGAWGSGYIWCTSVNKYALCKLHMAQTYITTCKVRPHLLFWVHSKCERVVQIIVCGCDQTLHFLQESGYARL